jgi:hypothetical protein
MALRPSTPGEFAEALPQGGVGVALTLNQINGTHVALVYRVQGVVMFCHLAAPFDLRNHPPSLRYIWEVAALSPRLREIVGSYLRLVAANNPNTIPYGFGYSGSYFNENGVFIKANEPGAGLTCSTFIMAIYQSLEIPLLVEDSWAKRPEDAVERQRIIEALQEAKPGLDLSTMTPFLEGVRFKPEEVAAGVIAAPPAIRFDAAQAAGAVLEKLIRTHLP